MKVPHYYDPTIDYLKKVAGKLSRTKRDFVEKAIRCLERAKSPKYVCTHCERESDYENDNMFDANRKQICDTCSRKHDAVSFPKVDAPIVSIHSDEIVLWYNALTGNVTKLWLENGFHYVTGYNGRPFQATLEELEDYIAMGIRPCTKCGEMFGEAELTKARGANASVLCNGCLKGHSDRAELERLRGSVCSKCGQPYTYCCC